MSQEYVIQCFIDGERKLTHELSKEEALIFRKTALHLVSYLEKKYGIENAVLIQENKKNTCVICGKRLSEHGCDECGILLSDLLEAMGDEE